MFFCVFVFSLFVVNGDGEIAVYDRDFSGDFSSGIFEHISDHVTDIAFITTVQAKTDLGIVGARFANVVFCEFGVVTGTDVVAQNSDDDVSKMVTRTVDDGFGARP